MNSSDRKMRARPVVWGVWVVIGVLQCSALLLFFTQPYQVGQIQVGDALTFLLAPLLNATLGLLVLLRHPGHLVGWLFIGMGGFFALGFFAQEWGVRELVTDPGSLFAGEGVLLLGWASANAITVCGGALAMVFPTGRFLSPRWRAVTAAGAGFAVLAVVAGIVSEMPPGTLFRGNVDLGQAGLGLVESEDGGLAGAFMLPVMLSSFTGVASTVVRYRRSRGRERTQLKVVAVTMGIALSLLLISEWSPPLPRGLNTVAGAMMILGLPVSAAFAILRHRLFDIDVVINKTIVYLALAATVTAIYVGIVVGMGWLIGSPGEPNLALSIAATAAVAVVFEPVRARAQHLANRLVYGARSTPLEVLTTLARRLSESYPTQESLERMARALADGTRAQAEIWVRTGSALRRAVSWPEVTDGPAESTLTSDGLPDLGNVAVALPVRYADELLGAIALRGPARPLTTSERHLAEDLATQAGLVMQNLRLTTELLARLDELQNSQERLLRAAADERRRLQRDLEERAATQLAAVKNDLTEAARGATRPELKVMLDQLSSDTDTAIRSLRELAHGVHPPVLTEEGLAAAIRARAVKLDVPVQVVADGVSRYDPTIEAAVYFCILEALQNVTKYAQASRVVVQLEVGDETLRFSVADDGLGFDPSASVRGAGTTNMRDRMLAVGGSLQIASQPGEGTVVRGTAPIRGSVSEDARRAAG